MAASIVNIGRVIIFGRAFHVWLSSSTVLNLFSWFLSFTAPTSTNLSTVCPTLRAIAYRIPIKTWPTSVLECKMQKAPFSMPLQSSFSSTTCPPLCSPSLRCKVATRTSEIDYVKSPFGAFASFSSPIWLNAEFWLWILLWPVRPSPPWPPM